MEDEFDPLPAPDPARMHAVAVALARAFLAGDAQADELRERGQRALGQPWPWLRPLALHVHFDFGSDFGPRQHDALVAAILHFPPFLQAFAQHLDDGLPAPEVRAHFPFHPPMASPPAPLARLALPALATPGELAHWLGLDSAQLDWLAGPQSRRPHTGKHAHYHYRWLRKASGGLRLIEAPKALLRHVQRRILHGILDHVPPHPAATGCVRGRSVLGNAAQHAAQPLLIKLDLRDFFPGIPAPRVHALFRSLGYPLATARCLTALCTHATPSQVLRALPAGEFDSPEERHRQHRRAGSLYQPPHLPQGAPTSPALANLCAFRLDLRLAGAAAECGLHYSRYVDDLAFSGPHAPAHGRRILAMVEDIVREEGFEPHWRKAGVYPASRAQRITGILVNRHPNIPRPDYDRLKATLTNCLRHGPASQNREGHPNFRAHLQGKVAWVSAVNPRRGEKLQGLLGRIVWDEAQEARMR